LPLTVRRIVLCVMLPQPSLRCKLRGRLSKDTVCVQTCKRGHPALQRVARFMNSEARQMSFYTATAIFRRRGRLTGFRSARNIVRVRTK